jgi:acetylornithine deacetylase/succinyl-diaminopimelate desuccinylase-like protein
MRAPRLPLRRPLALALLLALAASAASAADRLSREAEWLRDYLRLDTSNPPGHEAAGAAFLAALLRAHGLASERQVTLAGRTSLVARLPATEPDAPEILLVHHIDVVPAGEGWSVPPFAGAVRDGALVGRGAIDTKSLGIAHLAAFLEAARLPVRRRGLVYLAVADEEAGGGEGMGWLVEHRPELFARVEAALGEGGVNRTLLGRTHFWGLEVAQKRAYWLEILATGRPGHGSSLNPESAAHQLVHALARALARPAEWKLPAALVDYLGAFARVDPGLRARGVRAEEAIGPDGPAPWLPPAFWGLAQNTLQVTTLAAGERPNVVAGEARARLDVRLLPETDADAYLDELRRVLGRGIRLETLLATPPSPPSSRDTAVWRELAAALAPEAPVIPVMIPGITDSRFLRALGLVAYGLSPFEIEPDAMRRVHAPTSRSRSPPSTAEWNGCVDWCARSSRRPPDRWRRRRPRRIVQSGRVPLPPFWILFAGLVGLLVGSYLNVVIRRLPLGESTVRPPSRCPACGARIRAHDNLPVALLAPAARPLPRLPGADLAALSARRAH